MVSDPFENVLRVLKQRAFEKRESARLLEWDNDRHVLLLESEAGLAPLQCFCKVAVDSDLTQLICFLLPLLRIGNFHRSILSAIAENRERGKLRFRLSSPDFPTVRLACRRLERTRRVTH